MPQRELEQFVGRGEEKAFWILSYKNAGGLIVGAFIGSRVGELLGGGGWVFLMIPLCAIFSLSMTINVRGIMLAKRLIMRLRFWLSQALSPTVVDSDQLYSYHEEAEQLVYVREQTGTTVIGARYESA